MAKEKSVSVSFPSNWGILVSNALQGGDVPLHVLLGVEKSPENSRPPETAEVLAAGMEGLLRVRDFLFAAGDSPAEKAPRKERESRVARLVEFSPAGGFREAVWTGKWSGEGVREEKCDAWNLASIRAGLVGHRLAFLVIGSSGIELHEMIDLDGKAVFQPVENGGDILLSWTEA